jgi:hypothetical protein
MTDQFEQYEGYVTIGSAHEKMKKEGITIPIPTMRNWVNDLHQLKVHTIPRNQRGERIFNDKDIAILRFIHDAKQKFGNNLTMPAIATMIVEKFSEIIYYDPNFDNNDEGAGLPVLSEERLRDFLRQELQELQTLKSEMEQAKENYENRLRLIPSPEEEVRLRKEEKEQNKLEMRQLSLDSSFARNRVRKRLRERAVELWKANPKKTGLLFKKEDTAAKLEFIQQYELDHFDEEMKKEFGTSEE